ncbi:MAG: YfiR family protein [Candidatus Riflebacteria bacterium]|nr:YfiR family protein [Candidatus Riflebacteria bacterium]
MRLPCDLPKNIIRDPNHKNLLRFTQSFCIAISVLSWAVIFLSFFITPSPANCEERYPEYQVKAELLIRFAEFVNWPEAMFSSPDEPFIIAIAGKNPFGSYLERLAQKEKIREHKIQVISFDPNEQFQACHMIFISKAEQFQLEKILSQIKGHPILCVGDSETSSQMGAHIGFHTVEGRIRFSINLSSAKNCNLVLTSHLLRLANKIFDENNQ